MSIDSTKKLKFPDLTLQYLHYHDITLLCKKYRKFIKEFEEFINDFSITCSICSTQVSTANCSECSVRKIVSF